MDLAQLDAYELAWLRCRNMEMRLSLWMDWDTKKIIVYRQQGVNRMQVSMEDVIEDALDEIDEEVFDGR